MIGSNDRTPVLDVTVLTKGTLFLLIFGAIYAGLWVIRRYAVRVVAAYFVVIGLAVVVTEPLPRLTAETSTTAPPPTAGDVSDTAPPLVIHLLFDALLTPGTIERGIAGGDDIYKDCLFCRQSECYGPPSPSISLESIKSQPFFSLRARPKGFRSSGQ